MFYVSMTVLCLMEIFLIIIGANGGAFLGALLISAYSGLSQSE
jgi:hypothetical protein